MRRTASAASPLMITSWPYLCIHARQLSLMDAPSRVQYLADTTTSAKLRFRPSKTISSSWDFNFSCISRQWEMNRRLNSPAAMSQSRDRGRFVSHRGLGPQVRGARSRRRDLCECAERAAMYCTKESSKQQRCAQQCFASTHTPVLRSRGKRRSRS